MAITLLTSSFETKSSNKATVILSPKKQNNEKKKGKKIVCKLSVRITVVPNMVKERVGNKGC